MTKMWERLRRQDVDRGAAMVEFALVLPLFIGIVSAVLSGAIAFNTRLQLGTAAQEGARVVYLRGSVADAEAAAMDAAGAAATGAVVAPNAPCTASTSGERRTVTVNPTNPGAIRFLPLPFPPIPVDVAGRAVTRCP